MKASLPEVNQLTGKCFQMVRIVTKNNFFAIKISQRHDWETPSLCNYFLLTSTEINNDVFFFFWRAAKRGKFSRGAWEFNVVLNSRQKEIPEHKIIQIYDIPSIFT